MSTDPSGVIIVRVTAKQNLAVLPGILGRELSNDSFSSDLPTPNLLVDLVQTDTDVFYFTWEDAKQAQTDTDVFHFTWEDAKHAQTDTDVFHFTWEYAKQAQTLLQGH